MLGVISQFLRVLSGGFSGERMVRVRLTDTLEASVYDRPGRWMSDRDLAALQAELRGVGEASALGDLNYGVFLRDRRPFANRVVVVGRDRKTGAVTGFNAMPQLEIEIDGRPVTVLHLGLLVIHPQFRRRGLQGLLYVLGAFYAYRRIAERPAWISNVTEVPAVFGAVADQLRDPYPHHDRRTRPSDMHRKVALAIMQHHRHEFGTGPGARFDPDRFVIEGSYDGGSDALKKTFAGAAKHRKPTVNDFCQNQLDYQRGDDFLQIGLLDGTVMSRWLEQRVPAHLRPTTAREMKLWRYGDRR